MADKETDEKEDEEMKRKLKWIVVNGGMSAFMIAGVTFGVKGAMNVFTFCVFMFSIVSVLSLPDKKFRDDLHAYGRCVPKWCDVLFDNLVTGYLVWNGLWLLAIVYVIMSAINYALFERKW